MCTELRMEIVQRKHSAIAKKKECVEMNKRERIKRFGEWCQRRKYAYIEEKRRKEDNINLNWLDCVIEFL